MKDGSGNTHDIYMLSDEAYGRSNERHPQKSLSVNDLTVQWVYLSLPLVARSCQIIKPSKSSAQLEVPL